MQRHAFRCSRTERKRGNKTSFTCLHVNQTDRKLIILVSFLVKTVSFVVLCWENSSPLQPPLVAHARRAQFARFGWSTSAQSGCTAQVSQFSQGTMCATWTDSLAGSNSWQRFPVGQWKGERESGLDVFRSLCLSWKPTLPLLFLMFFFPASIICNKLND